MFNKHWSHERADLGGGKGWQFPPCKKVPPSCHPSFGRANFKKYKIQNLIACQKFIRPNLWWPGSNEHSMNCGDLWTISRMQLSGWVSGFQKDTCKGFLRLKQVWLWWRKTVWARSWKRLQQVSFSSDMFDIYLFSCWLLERKTTVCQNTTNKEEMKGQSQTLTFLLHFNT